eukprot:2416754-Prymnesium_polylepis.1
MLVAKVNQAFDAPVGCRTTIGAPASLSAAAARISDGLAGGVKAAQERSKLGEIEADTVLQYISNTYWDSRQYSHT